MVAPLGALTFTLCAISWWISFPGRLVDALAGGSPARTREFPFVAAFVRRTGTCTAVLLSEKWLITAAHCYSLSGRSRANPYLTDVYAGQVDVSEGCTTVGCQHRESLRAYIHPHYRPRVSQSVYDDARHNDLALLHVDKPFILNNPWVHAAVRASSAPTMICSCKVVGFGLGALGLYAFAPGRLLKAEQVPVLPAKLCPPARVAPLPRASLCSDSKLGVAPCLGDSGGPIVCDGRVTGLAMGVYESQWEYKQYAFFCGFFRSCSMFGLYTALEPFSSWIDAVVSQDPDSQPLNAANVSDPDGG